MDFSPAEPLGELAKPVYPPAALTARAGEYVAYVRITIDETGRVSAVEPSIRGLSVPHKFAEVFHEAIVRAAREWRFRAARLTHYKELDKGGGQKVLSIERTELVADTMDIRIMFDASGKVR